MTLEHDPTSTSGGAPALRTLLITDFVSSTELIETLGDKPAARIFSRHDRRARDILAAHKGVEIDKTDGFLFLFTRPIDAVRFSLSYHDMLRELSEETKVHLEARAGIHVGEVILRRNASEDVQRGAKPIEVDGLSKHAAARVMSVALGGQTLMTGPTYEIAKRGSVGEPDLPDDIRWVGHGRFRLKGIEDPVPLYEIGREAHSPLRPPPDSEKVQRVRSGRGGSRARKRWFLANLVVIFLAIVFISVYKLKPDPSPTNVEDSTTRTAKSNPTPRVDPSGSGAQALDPGPMAGEVDPPLSMIQLSVETRPPEALVVVGAEEDLSPLTLQVPAEVGLIEVTASLDGYQTRTTSCQIRPEHIEQGSSICTVELTRVPRTAPASAPASETGPSTTESRAPTGYEENPFGP